MEGHKEKHHIARYQLKLNCARRWGSRSEVKSNTKCFSVLNLHANFLSLGCSLIAPLVGPWPSNDGTGTGPPTGPFTGPLTGTSSVCSGFRAEAIATKQATKAAKRICNRRYAHIFYTHCWEIIMKMQEWMKKL